MHRLPGCFILSALLSACQLANIGYIPVPPTHPPGPSLILSTKTPLPSKTPPTPTLAPPHPTHTPETTPLPPIISASNVQFLTEIVRLDYGAWNLVHTLAWSPDGKILAVAAGEQIHLYQAHTLVEIRTLEAGVWTPSLSFSPDSQLLAAAGRDGRVYLWNVVSGQFYPHFPLEAHRKGVNSVDFDPQGQRIASGGNDGMARIWDVRSGEQLNQIIGGSFVIPAIAFTPPGENLAIVNGGLIRLRNASTTRFVHTLRGEIPIYSIAISPDGKLLAAGDNDNSIAIWDIENETIAQILAGPAGIPEKPSALVWDVAFNPDGSLLASAVGDGTLNIWDLSRGKLLFTLPRRTKAATCTAFSPDARLLASGGLDGLITIWTVVP